MLIPKFIFQVWGSLKKRKKRKRKYKKKKDTFYSTLYKCLTKILVLSVANIQKVILSLKSMLTPYKSFLEMFSSNPSFKKQSFLYWKTNIIPRSQELTSDYILQRSSLGGRKGKKLINTVASLETARHAWVLLKLAPTQFGPSFRSVMSSRTQARHGARFFSPTVASRSLQARVGRGKCRRLYIMSYVLLDVEGLTQKPMAPQTRRASLVVPSIFFRVWIRYSLSHMRPILKLWCELLPISNAAFKRSALSHFLTVNVNVAGCFSSLLVSELCKWKGSPSNTEMGRKEESI